MCGIGVGFRIVKFCFFGDADRDGDFRLLFCSFVIKDFVFGCGFWL